MIGKWLHWVLAVAAMSVGAVASAAVIVNDADDEFTVNWSKSVSGGTLTAKAVFDVQSISTGEAVFKVTVNNTTSGFVNAGIESISFLSDPSSTGSFVSAGSIFDGITSSTTNTNSSSIPSFKYHTVCVWAGNNCNGGGQGGLLAQGDDDIFFLKLIWSGGDSLQFPDSATGQQGTYGNWGIKFQTNAGSFEFPGTATCTSRECLEEFDVPSPAPLLLMGVGLLGVAAIRRKVL